jgi:hypothetical protein
METNQSGAGCVRGDGIVRQHDLSQSTIGTVERPVAFHGHDAIGDHEIDGNGCAQIKNALVNALPVENILWIRACRGRASRTSPSC